MKQKLLFLMLLLVTGGVSAWAQSNATSITSGGYYRICAAKENKVLYSNEVNKTGYLINSQANSADDTDVFRFNAVSGGYTISCVGKSGYYLGDFSSSTLYSKTDNWLTISTTSKTWNVTHYSSSKNYASAWTIGSTGIEATADGWMNYNSKGAVLKWKVVNGSSEDENSYFYLYPLEQYSVNVTGETGKNVTITANGHSSNAGNGGTLFIDASAAQGDLTATTEEGYTATVTSFDTSSKTITVNVTANRIVGTYKLTPIYGYQNSGVTAVSGTFYFSLPTDGTTPVLSSSETTVELVECGTGYMLRNSSGYYLKYKGGNNWDLLTTTNVSEAAVLAVSISGTTMTLTGTNGKIGINQDGSPDSNTATIYGDGDTAKNYYCSSWTIADFTPATTYTRVFEKAQSYTVCLPMAVTTSTVSNGTFYELARYSDETLHFNEVSGTTTAYKPYLFVTSAAGIVLTGDITAYSDQDLTTTVSGASMIGTVGSQVLVSGDNTLYGYKASDGTFVQLGTEKGAHINPFRAYISIPGVNEARTLSVTFEDSETTGISTMHNAQCLMHNEVYDLQGRNVSHFESLPKGLYIVNGKKVVIK
ncbi:MAG: hypothetical protein IJS97_07945 [Prevotella sp.]|nr:hypothetical protein [Prevotella sp.]